MVLLEPSPCFFFLGTAKLTLSCSWRRRLLIEIQVKKNNVEHFKEHEMEGEMLHVESVAQRSVGELRKHKHSSATLSLTDLCSIFPSLCGFVVLLVLEPGNLP